ncbi:MAG: acyl-CoA dehydrogenase [Alphaproteobacteria bacterium]|nr:acyl-CoA dehydrogenase [Alphaproteobacteria bacterium]
MTGGAIPERTRAALEKRVVVDDLVTAAPVAAMMATLGRNAPPPKDGDALPPLWHGMFGTTKLPAERLGHDGLPQDETLLPEMPELPRRLFAGARFEFLAPILIGERIRRTSRIAGFEAKEGRAGRLLFARVVHEIEGPRGLATLEENDIVYRAAESNTGGRAADPPPRADDAPRAWRMTVVPDPVLIFRHSAVTFNSHRVHYDRRYTEEAGMPGLLVQGMLIARLMLELVHREAPARPIARFSFRSGRPLYDTASFEIEGRPTPNGELAELRALAADGGVAMTAEVRFAR